METGMSHVGPRRAAILTGAILAFVASALMAESTTKKEKKVDPLFPLATRADPKIGVSGADMQEAIDKLIKVVNSQQADDAAIAQGEKLLGQKGTNNYERAVIDEVLGHAWLHKNDNAKAIDYIQKSIAQNALPNNEQYSLMLRLADVQIRAGQADAGLTTLDRVIAETKQDKPEYNAIRGRVYYNRQDYVAAAQAFQKAFDANPQQPDPSVQQMLFASYYELNQPERAIPIAQKIAAAHPDDKAAAMNLAAAYQKANQDDRAAAALDDARKRGLLTDANDYRKLYALYSNMKGHEKDSIAAINEGLQKGILQANEEVLTALAEDYYFSGQEEQAINAYRKADEVSTDGEAALNLAKIYHNQKLAVEAKTAAERALRKGIKHPEEARVLLGGTGTEMKKPGKKK
jgi:tetratricopeptide (TPR) repeat protein